MKNLKLNQLIQISRFMSLYKLHKDLDVRYCGSETPDEFQIQAIEICNLRKAYKPMAGKPITNNGIRRKLKNLYPDQTIAYVIEIKDTLNSAHTKMRLPDPENPQFAESTKITKPKKPPKSRYNAEKKATDNIKESINRQFAKKLKLLISQYSDNFEDKKTAVLYLDSKSMRTTKYLSEIGIKKEKLHTPNYSDDFYEMDHQLANLYNYSVGQWIENFRDKYKLIFCWLDYDLTYSGDKTAKICPRRDIDSLFKYEMLSCPSYFAVTFCQRNNSNWTIPEIMESILSTANRNGYYLTMEYIPELEGLNNNDTMVWTKLFLVDYT